MPSTPLICSSSGVATVSAITLGLAPGYWARTTTDGGATSGYSEIGSPPMAIRPAISISSESTPAKIGRSMKNLDRDRKSTRLNSSHLVISYAVFCLKKKKKHTLIVVEHSTLNQITTQRLS